MDSAAASSSSSHPAAAALDTLEYTPTWVVAAVCTAIVVISLSVERLLHYLGKFLKHKRQNALAQALQKLKEELMLLGFISLLLTVFQGLISHICIHPTLYSNMLPCKMPSEQDIDHGKETSFKISRNRHRLLSEIADSDHCSSQGNVPLLSLEALHQLHIFIFVLAIVHLGFCVATMILGGAKIRRWKIWEDLVQNEAQKRENLQEPKEPQLQKDLQEEKAGLTHHLHHDFIIERATRSCVMSFFKQFHNSVSKSDYIAMRSGFIRMHRRSSSFDFHKYMIRALEDDFKRVVGISWYLWLFVVVFLLLNISGWHTYFWLSFLPLILLLAVGAKLEHVITQLARELDQQRRNNDHGATLVKPSDQHFWFGRPSFVLRLIHFILFQNAFEMAFFFWIWSTYGFGSCYMERLSYLLPRLCMGVMIQFLCSYSTLPLYALVTQMGDSYKRAIFAEHMQSTLHGWYRGVKEKKRLGTLSSLLSALGVGKKKAAMADGEAGDGSRVMEACASSSVDLERPPPATGGGPGDPDAHGSGGGKQPAASERSMNSEIEIV